MNKLFLVICFLAISIPTVAQTTLIQADGYIDVENGELVTPANVVVEDGVITAINPSSLPMNAEMIDLQGSILLPGFMDMHVHLTVDFDGSWDYLGRESGSKGAIRGAINARKTLMAGFTTVRDVGQLHLTKELINVSLAQAVEEGVTVGPRIIASGHMISITGGHGDPAMSLAFPEGLVELTPEYGIVNSADDAVAAVRYQIKHGAKVIKMHATAGVLSAEKIRGGSATQRR